MKGFGKFLTFVGVTGAALAGLWYFCETNKEKCECSCEDGDGDVKEKKQNERSYVSLDPETKEELKEAADEVKEVFHRLHAAMDAAAAADCLDIIEHQHGPHRDGHVLMELHEVRDMLIVLPSADQCV